MVRAERRGGICVCMCRSEPAFIKQPSITKNTNSSDIYESCYTYSQRETMTLEQRSIKSHTMFLLPGAAGMKENVKTIVSWSSPPKLRAFNLCHSFDAQGSNYYEEVSAEAVKSFTKLD